MTVLPSISGKELLAALRKAGFEVARVVSFSDFPWFKDAPIAKLANVERPQPHHLRWPDLDVDLAVESIRDPAKFPLVAKHS